jgi:PAS domain S-box-containing protein
MLSNAEILNAGILIVDDQEANVLLLEQMLRNAGYTRISSTMDPRAVCALHLDNHYDLILLDLQMPGMDGFQVMESLKAIETGGYLPVLAVTAQPAHKLRALQCGAKDFVSKPFDLVEVLMRVHNLLEVRLLHEYAESIINTVREPLIALDQDLRVVSASRSFYEVFKVTPKETVGQLIYDLGNKQWNIPKLRELLETILPEKATFDNYEVEHEFSTIGSRIMLLNARQIKRVWGKERIILLAIEDITERKKLEQKINQYSKELERSNVELSNFGSIVAHDLGAPLRAVSGFAGLLQKRYKEKLDAGADEYISHIVEGTGRMQHLIKDLLEYARVGTSSKPLVQVDVNIIIEKALANLMFEITESRAVITADTLPTVSADDTRLIQLFQNIVGNAIKYRSNTPHIHISAERKDGEWLFRISDNGIGIEPRQFERIFQIFQRLHTREEYSGTGIGLAICKKIVERLGGRIWVESKPDEGSTFFFTLPATE